VNTAINPLQSDGAGGTVVDLFATNFRELGGFTTLDGAVALRTAERLQLRLYGNHSKNQKRIPTRAVARIAAESIGYLTRALTGGFGVEYSFGE